MTALQRISDTSAIAPEALTDRRSGKPRRVPRKIIKIIDLMQDGICKTIQAACDRVGMNRSHVSRTLGLPHVQVFIAQRNRERSAEHSLRASARLGELVDAKSEHVAFEASKFHYALQGLAPKQQGVSVDVNIRAGYVIRLGASDAPGAGQARPQAIGGQIEASVRVAGETNQRAGEE